MKKFINFIFKRFTIGAVINITGWVIFAFILRHFYTHIIDIYYGELDNMGLDVFFLLFFYSIRFVFKLFLEFILGDYFHLSMYDLKSGVGLFMDDTGSKGIGESSNKSTQSDNDSSSKLVPKEMSKEDFEELMRKLDKDMFDTCTTQNEMIDKLRQVKGEKNINLFSDKGNLEISVPNTMSEEESQRVSKQVGIIDRIINTKFSEYKSLRKQDIDLNNGKFSKTWDSYNKANKIFYENTFDEEDT